MDGNSSRTVGVIACGVLERELGALARFVEPAPVCVVLEQGLHNEPEKLRCELQRAIFAMEAEHPDVTDIALLYGICSRGAEGVQADRCRMALPRAHDCITLLLGCRQLYKEYVAQHPGTYWYSPGWIDTGFQPGPGRYKKKHQEYLEQFDEEDAEYLMEIEQGWMQKYNRAAYVDVGVTGDPEPDIAFTKQCAEWLGWDMDRLHGDAKLMQDLISGNWDDERYLVLQPGEWPKFVDDDRIVIAATGEFVPEKSSRSKGFSCQ